MMMTRSRPDELHRIRRQIAELRARESALEASFIEMNDTDRFPGFDADVIVERTTHEVFDIMKLPIAIRNDQKYYSTRNITAIRLEERDSEDDVLARSLAAFVPGFHDSDEVLERF